MLIDIIYAVINVLNVKCKCIEKRYLTSSFQKKIIILMLI